MVPKWLLGLLGTTMMALITFTFTFGSAFGRIDVSITSLKSQVIENKQNIEKLRDGKVDNNVINRIENTLYRIENRLDNLSK